MTTPNVSTQIRGFKTIYWALSVIQLVVGVGCYAMISTGILGSPDYSAALTFQKIALIFIPGAMAAGYFLFRGQLSRVDSKLSLEEKLKKYFGLALVRAALFEVAFFYCCVAAFVTKVLIFLWIAPVVFFVFLLLRPTPENIINDLQLNPSDSGKVAQS